jgi:flagellar biosynthesis/type III secretory pathway M-ring protein FliF/YscJ
VTEFGWCMLVLVGVIAFALIVRPSKRQASERISEERKDAQHELIERLFYREDDVWRERQRELTNEGLNRTIDEIAANRRLKRARGGG